MTTVLPQIFLGNGNLPHSSKCCFSFLNRYNFFGCDCDFKVTDDFTLARYFTRSRNAFRILQKFLDEIRKHMHCEYSKKLRIRLIFQFRVASRCRSNCVSWYDGKWLVSILNVTIEVYCLVRALLLFHCLRVEDILRFQILVFGFKDNFLLPRFVIDSQWRATSMIITHTRPVKFCWGNKTWQYTPLVRLKNIELDVVERFSTAIEITWVKNTQFIFFVSLGKWDFRDGRNGHQIFRCESEALVMVATCTNSHPGNSYPATRCWRETAW